MPQLLHPQGTITSEDVIEVAEKESGTPLYLYDGPAIKSRCGELISMPNDSGLTVRYAMKANSSRAILQLVDREGLSFDLSSMNEARRMHLAGVPEIPYNKGMLTTQEVPRGQDMKDLEEMMIAGLRYNVCSITQLENIAGFAGQNKIPLSIRLHPEGEVGSGESITRNTASKYSCFGIHVGKELGRALDIAENNRVLFGQAHDHIGSGGNPEKWRENIDVMLNIVRNYLLKRGHPIRRISFGGGIKEARMPQEEAADIDELGEYARERLNQFYEETGIRLHMEIEPGTFIIANSGNLVTRVLDKKTTGEYDFLVLDGGMEVNTRPLLYGSEHPFYVVSKNGELLSSEFNLSGIPNDSLWVPVGRCCESGDSQSLDEEGHIVPRKMAEPKIGDYVVIGGCGVYGRDMSPANYNSHLQAPEYLKLGPGKIPQIRKKQDLEQLVQNEIGISQREI